MFCAIVVVGPWSMAYPPTFWKRKNCSVRPAPYSRYTLVRVTPSQNSFKSVQRCINFISTYRCTIVVNLSAFYARAFCIVTLQATLQQTCIHGRDIEYLLRSSQLPNTWGGLLINLIHDCEHGRSETAVEVWIHVMSPPHCLKLHSHHSNLFMQLQIETISANGAWWWWCSFSVR